MLVRFTLRIYMVVRFTLRLYILVRFTLWIYMLVRFYIVLHCGVLDCMIYVHELKIKLLKSKFESCPVSSCSRSSYLGIVTSFFPASQASCELVFPLLFLRRSRSNSLNAYFPDLCLEGQKLSSQYGQFAGSHSLRLPQARYSANNDNNEGKL